MASTDPASTAVPTVLPCEAADTLPAPLDTPGMAGVLNVWTTPAISAAVRSSLDSRAHTDTWAPELTHGMLPLTSFAHVLAAALEAWTPSDKAKAAGADLFIDIGSGVGILAAAASTVDRFSAAVGMEIEPCLATSAAQLAKQYQSGMAAGPASSRLQLQAIDAASDSAMAYYSKAGVILWNAICFQPPLLRQIAKILERAVPSGSIIIMTGPELPSRLFELVTTLHVPAGWVKSTQVRFYRKLRLGGWAAAMLPKI